jgi:hypothetical protein
MSAVRMRFSVEFSMIYNWFGIHDGLATSGRIPSLTRVRERISGGEFLLLLVCGGAAAAAVGFIRLGLRLPGHSIVLTMIPMVLGLALAPRRCAGFIMSAGAFSTAALFNFAGWAHYGTGAFVSLCLMGPMMDLALTKARRGWRLYSGIVLAGIVTNLLALTSRGTSKLLGLDLASARPFVSWWSQAAVTYSLCGAVAGLIAALCFFHLRNQRSGSEAD